MNFLVERFHRCLLPLFMIFILSHGAYAKSTTWDLALDWSNSTNPNGVWSYNKSPNTPMTVLQNDWDPTNVIFGTAQPAWADAPYPYRGHVPMWAKRSSNWSNMDVPAGTVVMHGSETSAAGVTWTSPINGKVDIIGGIWQAQKAGDHSGRSMDWSILHNGKMLTSGVIAWNDVYTSASPLFFSSGTGGASVLRSVEVGVGDIITLQITKRSFYASFAGVQLQIAEIAPEAPTTSTITFPHIADGGGYKTTILLTNSSETTATALISFFSSYGTPLDVAIDGITASEHLVDVAAMGSVKLTTSGASSFARSGWAQVSSTPAVGLNGNAIFQRYQGSSLFSEASVPASQPARCLDFFADESGAFSTGFAMANPGPADASGLLTLYGIEGAVAATWPIYLQAGHHNAVFLFQIIPGATSGRAELLLDSGAIAVTALRFHESSVFSTVSVGQPGFASSGIASYFSSNGRVENQIISEIDRAESSIDIAVYSFTADAIRNALLDARSRGVAIRVVADLSQSNVLGSEIGILEQAGFDVRRRAGELGGVMHNKYMIIDKRLLITGSYDWLVDADVRNYENVVLIQSSDVIRKYTEDFKRIWNQ